MAYKVDKIFGSVRVVERKDYQWAVLDLDGNVIVPFGKYDWIDGFEKGFARVKIGKRSNGYVDNDNKWGVINESGEEVIPCIYSNMWRFYKTNYNSVRVVDGIVRKSIPFSSLKRKSVFAQESFNDFYEERPTYNNYNGSYAQDVMGYSDDVINDAFDGDPDAYWNID